MTAAIPAVTWLFWGVFCVANVLMAGFFAGIETGIYLMNGLRIELDAESEHRPALLLRDMLKNPNRMLAVLLAGTNLHQYLATFSISTLFVLAGEEDNAEWYTMAVAVPLFFIFAESVPKHVFRRRTEPLVYGGVGLLHVADLLFHAAGFAAAIRLFSGGLMSIIRRDRVRQSRLGRPEPATIVAEGHASGILSPSQAKMAHRLMSIPTITLRGVMIPLRKAATLPADVGRAAFVSRVAGHNYSRVPLIGRDNRVTYIVNVYDVLVDDKGLDPAHFGANPLLLDADIPIVDALSEMQQAGAAMAIVTGPGGRHLGLVTIKDLVEEIVGELEEW